MLANGTRAQFCIHIVEIIWIKPEKTGIAFASNT